MRSAKCFLSICSLLIVVGLCTQAADAVDEDRMLVINGLAETLSLVDRAGDSVVVNLRALGLAPNDMAMTTNSILLTNSISDELWVLDRDTYQVQQTVSFPDGDNPYNVAVVNDSLCVVSLTLRDEIMYVNPATGDTLQRVAVGTSPQGLCVQDVQLWVANTGLDYNTFLYGQGSVTVLGLETATHIATINVGTNPQVIAEAADGSIHVMCTGNFFDQFGIVYIIDPVTLVVDDSLTLGGSPGDLVFTPDGIGYVAAGGWVDSGYVYRYDAVSRTLLNSSANPWTSAQGVIGVMPRLEGGIFAFCFAADSVIGHGIDGTVEEAYQLGDGPQPGVHISNRLPGDISDDGSINSTDLNLLIKLLFFNGSAGSRPNAADVNHDCKYDSSDLNRLINTIFFNGMNSYWGCAE